AETTGIFKEPVDGPAQIGSLGVAGDVVVNKKHHGGPDQAVYIYGQVDSDWWSRELGRELPPGTFGENLTIAGLESAACSIGDRLQIGAVLLEVTAPRIPCSTLAARMGDPNFIKRYRLAERPGLYCRVLREGALQAGDPVVYQPFPGEAVTILEVFRDYYQPDRSEADIRRFLAAPLAIRVRKVKEEQLRAKLEEK
ncbi:MAG TPA: MOSC domain-containing protein, partial [Anaerolineaceae bacterium]|nr:MOSC domain-containing protein [Anaerolineaceae bacterium]